MFTQSDSLLDMYFDCQILLISVVKDFSVISGIDFITGITGYKWYCSLLQIPRDVKI